MLSKIGILNLQGCKGIEVILHEFFGNDSSLSYCLSFENEFNAKQESLKLEYQTNLKKYNDYVPKINKLIEEKNSYIEEFNKSKDEKRIGIKKNIDEKELEIKNIEKKRSDFEIIYKSSKEKYLNFKLDLENPSVELKNFGIDIIKTKNYPKILISNKNIFDNDIEIMLPSKNKYTYKLCSASISLPNINHAIAAIICNGKNYVYDSNNIIVETNWPKKDISKYLNDATFIEEYITKHKGVTPLPSPLPFSITYLIYIRQPIENFK